MKKKPFNYVRYHALKAAICSKIVADQVYQGHTARIAILSHAAYRPDPRYGTPRRKLP